MKFLAALFSTSDDSADSIIFAGVFAVLALVFFTGWDLIALGHEFSPIGFAGAITTILAGIGGGKAVRDRWIGGDGTKGGGVVDPEVTSTGSK